MGKFFNLNSPFFQGLSRFADLVILNLFTVLCSLPIVTIGAAVTALYDAVGRLQQDEGSIYAAYFRAFRSNFKQATIQWLFLLVCFVLLAVALPFYLSADSAFGQVLLVLEIILLFLWCSIVTWVFPLQAKFYNSVSNMFRNSLLCALGYLPRTLLMVVLNILPWALFLLLPTLFVQIGFIWLLIWFSLVANINLRLLKKPYQKMGVEDIPA